RVQYCIFLSSLPSPYSASLPPLHSFPTRRSSDLRFQTALASIKLIQASAVLDLTEDDFDFLTSNKVWIATDRSRARQKIEIIFRSEERFSRNAETDLVCRLLLEKKKVPILLVEFL